MKNKYIDIEKIIDKSKIKYNELMSKNTTMKVGGPCDVMILPTTIDEIKEVIKYAKNKNINCYVLGNGSNTIVKDEGIRGIVIKIANNFSDIKVEDDYMIIKSGVSMPFASIQAKKNLLKGFEFACGIPGTIGGGVRMNAGAYDGQMSDIVDSVTCLNTDSLDIVTINKDKLDFGYRHSIFTNHKNYVILEVKFKLQKGNIDEIEEKMKSNNSLRRTKQPLEYPSVGSIFKRPTGYFVGKLVSDAGLRGASVGGAQVSEKHTGFIINKDKATCRDILDLIKLVQDTVYSKFNVKLEVEPEIIGGEN